MRRSIRIKASTLLFAWFIIFAHGIIPHNHRDNPCSDCHNLFHNAAIGNTPHGNIPAYETLPEEKTVCHYSGFIFHELNTDNLIMVSDKPALSDPSGFSALKIFYGTHLFISGHQSGISALRAPPLT